MPICFLPSFQARTLPPSCPVSEELSADHSSLLTCSMPVYLVQSAPSPPPARKAPFRLGCKLNSRRRRSSLPLLFLVLVSLVRSSLFDPLAPFRRSTGFSLPNLSFRVPFVSAVEPPRFLIQTHPYLLSRTAVIFLIEFQCPKGT